MPLTSARKDIVNNERINAEQALNQAITTMVERHAAMWEAHAELHQLSIRRSRNKTAKASRLVWWAAAPCFLELRGSSRMWGSRKTAWGSASRVLTFRKSKK
jgi:hypothetical protein